MKVGNLFYFGQLLLIGLILLFNCVIFVIVNYKLTCGRHTTHTNEEDRKKETMKRLQNAVVISVLLGLTWGSAFLVIIESVNFVFQIIFCLLNSLQGVFIFLLFCVRQDQIRRVWRAWLVEWCCRKCDACWCCHKYDSKHKGRYVPSSTGTGTGTSSERGNIPMSKMYTPVNSTDTDHTWWKHWLGLPWATVPKGIKSGQ